MAQCSHLVSLGSHMHEHGALFRAWLPPNEPCDGDGDRCDVPDGEPTYVSRFYNDAPVLEFDPPLEYHSEEPVERTLRFCAVLDNGFEDVGAVKRQSTSPGTPNDIQSGGPCEDAERYCIGGNMHGEHCGADANVCSSGGACDACPLTGSVTTQDEMMILSGAYLIID